MLIQSSIKYTSIIILLTMAFSSNTLLAKTKTNQNTVDFQYIKEYANLSDAAYHSLKKLRQTTLLKDYSITQHSTIKDIGLSYFLISNAKTKTHVIAIRGTSNIENTILDISLKLKFNKHTGLRLHSGFLQAAQAIYTELKPAIRPSYTINTTGHSLGGAVAVVLAMYFDSDNKKIGQVITFGQPKVTNIAGAYKFKHLNIKRVVTQKDPVPVIPLIDPMDINDLDIYWHQGTEILLLSGSEYAVLEGLSSMLRATKFTQEPFTENNFKNHKMSQYLLKLSKRIPSAKLVPFSNNFNLFNLFSDEQ